MLIVEGPDGSGKTTLVQRLSKDLNLPVAPRVVRADTTAMVNLAEWTEQNINGGFQHTIFDRHRLISEPIYGPVLRGRQDEKFMDLGWMSQMTWQFYSLQPIIVYCLPHIGTVWRNVSDPSTDNAKLRDIGTIEAIYAGYVNRATLDFSRQVGRLYNYETTLYTDILRWAKFKLEVQNDRAGNSGVLPAAAG